MRLVLATPPFNLFKDGYGTKRSIKKGHMPPLGIGYLSSVTLKEGIDTYIVDPSPLGMDLEETVDMIAGFRPDVVGISTLTATNVSALGLAGMLKKKLGVTVIVGGPHATCYPEEIMESCEGVDYVVSGEGEKVIIELLERIRKKESPRGLNGVTFREGGSIIPNGKANIEKDLDNIEMPAYRLYKNEFYSPLPYSYRALPATGMVTSRGCPYSKCAFCYSAGKMKAQYRRNSPARVVNDIKSLVRGFGIKEILFYDDNFLFNEKWVAEFCDRLKKDGIDISWSCAGRADTVNSEMLKTARSAGCWTVFYGFESGIQRLLDTIRKGITLEEIRRAVRWTHEAGLETRGSFMLALPGETAGEALETIRFAIDLDLDYAQFHATFTDPGTELFEIAKTKGRVEFYRGMNKATFIPDGYKDGAEVERLVRLAYRRFYFRPGYVMKRLASIRSFSDLSRYAEGFLFVKGLQ